MKNLFLLSAIAFVLGSCNMSYEKTKSGLRYKIIKGNKGEKLKPGDIIKFNQVALIPERDTILFTTYGKMPGYVKVDSAKNTSYTIMEVFPLMSVGDSAVVVLSVDSLKNKGMIQNYDEAFRRGGQVTIRLKVLRKFSSEEEANAEVKKDAAAETERKKKESEETVKAEKKALEDYLAKNNIKTIKTPSGAFVEVQQKGSGVAGDSSLDAVVIYTGKLFKTGTTFDGNAGTGKGLKFSLGQNSMIKAFDEGMMYFGKGGKGRIYVPSDLGYGPQGSPDGRIPPNSTLVFEVEMVDLQKRAGGAMPFPVEVNLNGTAVGHSKDDGHGH
jgi:FKBP-type peptidyl-prolyl cis-trans isomerase FkpA